MKSKYKKIVFTIVILATGLSALVAAGLYYGLRDHPVTPTSSVTAPVSPQATPIHPPSGPYVAPTETNDSSEGATALCSDGTYSYSVNHSGTCSHHGGVAEWYQ